MLFQEKHRAGLSFLDDATEAILFDVGRMLGMILAGCVRQPFSSDGIRTPS